MLNTSTAPAAWPFVAPAERGRQQFPRLRVGIERERLLDLPLILDELLVRLGDAVARAPGVLVVEDHVAPGVGELGRRILSRVEHGPEGFGLHEPLGGGAVDRRFPGRRARPVLPVRREIAANDGNLVGVAFLELAEQLARGGDDHLGIVVLRVPVLHQSGSDGVGRAVVAADAPPQLHDVVGIPLPLQLREAFRQLLVQLESASCPSA